MQPVPTIVPFISRSLEQTLLVILFSITLLGSGINFHIRQCHQYHLTVLNEQLKIIWGILSLKVTGKVKRGNPDRNLMTPAVQVFIH